MSLFARPLRSLTGVIFVAGALGQTSPANIVTVTVPVCITPYSFLANTTQALSSTPSMIGSVTSASAATSGTPSVVVSSFCGQDYIASGQPYYVSCNSSLTGRIIQSSTGGTRKRATDLVPNGNQFTSCLDLCDGEAACEAVGVSKVACTLYADVQQAAAAVGVVAAYNVRRFAGFVASNGSVTGYLPGQTPTVSATFQAATSLSSLAKLSASTSSAFWHPVSSSVSVSTPNQASSYTSTTFGYAPSAESTVSSQMMSSLDSVSSYTPTTFGYSPPAELTSTGSSSQSSAAHWASGSFTLSTTSTSSLSTTSMSTQAVASSAPRSSSSSNPPSASPTTPSFSSTGGQQASSTPSSSSSSTSSASSSITSSSSTSSPSPTSTVIPDCDDVPFIAAPTVCTDPLNNTWTLSNSKTFIGNFVSSSNDSPDIDTCLEKCDVYAGCVAVNWQSQSYANCILMTQVYGSQTPSGGSGASCAQRLAGYSSIYTAPPASTAAS